MGVDMDGLTTRQLSGWQVSLRLARMARPLLGWLIGSAFGRVVSQLSLLGIFALSGLALGVIAGGGSIGGPPADVGPVGYATAEMVTTAEYTPPSPIGNWVPLVSVLLGLALLRGLASYLEHFLGHFVAFRSLEMIRVRFFEALIPQAPFDARTLKTGDLLTTATKDIDRIEVYFAHTLVPLIGAVVVPCVTVGVAAGLVHPLMALVLGAGVVVTALVPLLGQSAGSRAGRALAQVRGEQGTYLVDTLQSAREIISYQQVDARIAGLRDSEVRLADALGVSGRVDGLRQSLVSMLPVITMLVLTVMGGYLFVTGTVGLPGVFACIAVAIPAHIPATAIEGFASELKLSFASARRVFAAMDRAPSIPASVQAVAPDEPRVLEVDHVTLGYSSNTDALVSVVQDVSFRVQPGQMVAVVGSSGSGKSTLAAALVRLMDACVGSVRLAGLDLRDWDVDALRDEVAIVRQREYLFAGSVRDNLLMAAPGATERDLLQACQWAGLCVDVQGNPVTPSAHGEARDALNSGEAVIGGVLGPSAFLIDLPKGLDTQVGPRATQISGGQKQRIALARALLRTQTLGIGRARILILDEATSDLDVDTQAVVTASIEAHAKAGGSTIVVAHRLSTIQDADEILVMENGRIVERGRHQELLDARGLYAQMWSAQME
ncbi:MAG: ABC transporter ATP-binding protein [Actinomycetaceae bacterium]|nr:ABC transporter ATP-binding protein [Actinomycetaceae bacterium]